VAFAPVGCRAAAHHPILFYQNHAVASPNAQGCCCKSTHSSADHHDFLHEWVTTKPPFLFPRKVHIMDDFLLFLLFRCILMSLETINHFFDFDLLKIIDG
jgi:hypothetical protein